MSPCARPGAQASFALVKIYCRGERPEARRSNHRGDFFQADDAGERAHFALLVLAQLEQQRHRRRLQLLHLFGIGIDRRAGGARVGLPRRVDLATPGQ